MTRFGKSSQAEASQEAEMHEIRQTVVTISGPGGPLQGVTFQSDQPQLAIQIAPATGVPASYYAAFAQWLAADQNAVVLVFDYRDFASSGAGRDIRHSGADMADWGIHDAHAARGWLKARHPALPLWVIGHSLGGMVVPFQKDLHQIDRLITVGSGAVHWHDHPWPMKARVMALWFALGPVTTQAMGYLPGRKIGLGADLPADVYWQWRKWCTTKGSCLADPSLPPLQSAALTCPVTLVTFSDDDMIPSTASWRLEAWMQKATVTRRLLDPKDFGLKSVGHIAGFTPRNRAAWPAIIAP